MFFETTFKVLKMLTPKIVVLRADCVHEGLIQGTSQPNGIVIYGTNRCTRIVLLLLQSLMSNSFSQLANLLFYNIKNASF